MNVQELIHQSEADFRSHTVDKEAFRARFFTRLANEPTSGNALVTRKRANSTMRGATTLVKQLTSAGTGLALACGLVAVLTHVNSHKIERQPGSAKATYFGLESPFQPKIPAHILSGYKLTSSGWDMSFKDNETHFVEYEAQFKKEGPVSSKYAPISIYELPGDSVRIKKQVGIPASGIVWNKSVRTHNQTYYVSNTWETKVGFVKNHIVYILTIASDNMDKSLLQCAENMSVVAPIQWSQRSANTYRDAITNISFHPVVPKVPSQYVDVGTGSQVVINGKKRSEYLVLNYQLRNVPQQSIQIVEVPLDDVRNPYKQTARTNTIVLPDRRRQIEFTVRGSHAIPESELRKIISVLQSTTN